jgi:hypothetical protein
METEKASLIIQNAFNSEMVNCYNKEERCVKISSKQVLDKILELLAE